MAAAWNDEFTPLLRVEKSYAHLQDHDIEVKPLKYRTRQHPAIQQSTS